MNIFSKFKSWISHWKEPWSFEWDEQMISTFYKGKLDKTIKWDDVDKIIGINQQTMLVPSTTLLFYCMTKEDPATCIHDLMPGFNKIAEWMPVHFKGIPHNWRETVEIPQDKENRVILWQKH